MRIKIRAAVLAVGALWGSAAFAQNRTVNFVDGNVLTAAQLNAMQLGFVNTTNGAATGLTLTNGKATGTDISATHADTAGNNVSSYLSPKTSRPRYIFFGGANNFNLVANTSPTLINSGKLALYEHGVGAAAITTAERAAIQTTFAPTGSSLVTGGGNAMGEIGFPYVHASLPYFGGALPVEDNVNIFATESDTFTDTNGTVYSYFFTAADLTSFKSDVDLAIADGAKNLAPVIAPNAFDGTSAGTDFSTNGYWANLRQAALYAGGISIDAPPTFALWQGDDYISTIISEIKWGLANNIRVTLIISPYNVLSGALCGDDTEIWNNTSRFMDILVRNDAIPTSYVVETYCGSTPMDSNPLTGSTDLSGSMDHIVNMLLNYPVSPAATASYTGTVSGGASEAQVFNQADITTATGSSITSPTYVPAIADMTQSGIGASVIGSMGFQSADNVLISGGSIGTTHANGGGNLDVFLSSGSTFLTQTALTFQGSGGNISVSGSSSDPFLHLSDGYTSADNTIGIMFGTASGSPLLSKVESYLRSTAPVLFGSGTAAFQGPNIAAGNPQITAGTDGALILENGYSSSATIGIQFGSSLGPSIVSTDSGSDVLLKGGKLITTNSIQLAPMAKSIILSMSSPTEGEIVNDFTDNVPVIYENGKWYPLTLGTALTQ